MQCHIINMCYLFCCLPQSTKEACISTGMFLMSLIPLWPYTDGYDTISDVTITKSISTSCNKVLL